MLKIVEFLAFGIGGYLGLNFSFWYILILALPFYFYKTDAPFKQGSEMEKWILYYGLHLYFLLLRGLAFALGIYIALFLSFWFQPIIALIFVGLHFSSYVQKAPGFLGPLALNLQNLYLIGMAGVFLVGDPLYLIWHLFR